MPGRSFRYLLRPYTTMPLSLWLSLSPLQILCFEVVTKEGADYTLHYVAGAVAHTDAPSTLVTPPATTRAKHAACLLTDFTLSCTIQVELIKQRRRWLNGALFALIYYITHFNSSLFRARHSIPRLLLFLIQFLYQLGHLLLNWLMLGTFYIALFSIFRAAFADFALQHIVLCVHLLLLVPALQPA